MLYIKLHRSGGEDGEARSRTKRDVDYYSNFGIEGEYDVTLGEADSGGAGAGQDEAAVLAEEDTAELEESLLSSAHQGHNVRNIRQKILKIGQQSQVTYKLKSI